MASDYARLLIDLEANTAKFTKPMQDAAGTVQRFGAAMKAVGGFLVGAAITRSIVNMGKAAAETADTMAKLAARTETNIKDLYAVKLAADNAGIGFEKVEIGVNRMQRTLGDALSGGSAAKDFASLGIDPAKLALMGMDEQLVAVGRSLEQFSTSSERAAALSKVFGKAGVLMTRFFDDNTKAVKEAQAWMDKFGFNMDYSDIENMNDRISEAKLSFELMAQSVVSDLAPAITSVAVKVAQIVADISKVDWLNVFNFGENKNKGMGGKTLGEQLKQMNSEAAMKAINNLEEAEKRGMITHDEYSAKLSAIRRNLAEANATPGKVLNIGHIRIEDIKALDEANEKIEKLKALQDNMRREELEGAAAKVKEGLLSPYEKEMQDLSELDEMLKLNLITREEYDKVIRKNAGTKMLDSLKPAFESMKQYVTEMKSFSESVITETQSPFEKYIEHIWKLDTVLQAGMITADQYWKSLTGAFADLQNSAGMQYMQGMAQSILRMGQLVPSSGVQIMDIGASRFSAPGQAASMSASEAASMMGGGLEDINRQQLTAQKNIEAGINQVAFLLARGLI